MIGSQLLYYTSQYKNAAPVEAPIVIDATFALDNAAPPLISLPRPHQQAANQSKQQYSCARLPRPACEGSGLYTDVCE